MNIYIALWIVFIVSLNGEETIVIEESTTELCVNSTEDSCEAYNNTESSATDTTPAEEVTQAPTSTKKPKTTLSPQPTTKKPSPASNATTRLQPNSDCTCDSTRGGCEVNCCCDVDCSGDQRAVFTHCMPVASLIDTEHCFPPHTLHHNNTEYTSAVIESGLLCVVQQNTILSTDFTNVPVIKTIAALEYKLGQRNYFSWNNPASTLPVFDADSSYSNGSPIWISENFSIMHLELPITTGFSSLCHGMMIPRYLESTGTSCTKHLRNEIECHNSREPYFSVITSPRNFNFTQIQECTEEVCLPVQNFICTDSCSKRNLPTPRFNNTSSTCLNVVKSVEYQILHNGSQGIVEVNAFYKLQNISVHRNRLYRKYYRISYQWAGTDDKPLLSRSGLLGYETGKPIISGIKTLKKVAYSTSKDNWINIGTAGDFGVCQNRYNLIFRDNIMTRCMLNVSGTCKQIQQQVWQQLLKPTTNMSEVMISSFGDPQENYEDNWVPLLRTEPPPLPTLVTSVNIVVVYSLVGAVALPQAKIIAVHLTPLSSGVMCSANLTTVAVETSVQFMDKTTPAVTKFAQPPVYEIKLPQDFFYPFFSSAEKAGNLKCLLLLVIFTVLK